MKRAMRREHGAWVCLMALAVSMSAVFGALAEKPETAKFAELPPELSLPTSKLRGEAWARNAIVMQPWGYTQRQMMETERKDFPSQLKSRYGFNVICVMPPEALAAVGGGKQSEEEFKSSLAAYRAAGYRVILYSSLVNVGHDPQWYRTLKENPEWRQVDASGKSRDWLCPNNDGVFDQAIEYTPRLVTQYGADGVMLDNNAFMDAGGGKPVCYCSGCRGKFREYVAARFGKSTRKYFGVAVKDVEIPRTSGALYNLWKHWRTRTWVEIMERARRALPDIALFANTQYWYWTSGANGWFLAHDRLYGHEDMLLSESYFMDPREVSLKMKLGRALALDRPLFDLVGTFEWNAPRFSPLKPEPVISRLTAAALAHTANPWLGYYGMEGDDATNAASRQALSQLLLFRAKHPEFYINLQPLGSVASILPTVSYTYFGTGHPVVPPHVAALSDAGIESVGVCDLNLCSEELTRFKVIVAEGVSCLDAAGSSNLVQWIKKGGTLITTADLATFDEIGRKRPKSKVAETLALDALSSQSVGSGNIDVVPSSGIVAKVTQVEDKAIKVSGLDPKAVQVCPYKTHDDRLLLHLINYSPNLTNSWTIQLPDGLDSKMTNLVLYRPEKPTRTSLKVSNGQIGVPPINSYAVISADEP